MRIDPDTCRDPDLLAAEVRRLQAVIDAMPHTAEAPPEPAFSSAGKSAETGNAPEPDRLQPIATDNAANPAESVGDSAADAGTSVETGIPPEWLSRPYYVDPPEGWRYGFPRLYDPQSDGTMREWMIRNGYPKKLAKLGLPCTFTAVTS